MSDKSIVVDVGAWGWSHTGWQDSFYPDDLPDDWRFQYYTSKYRTVVFSADEALEVLQEDRTEYLEAMDDQFEFFVEISPALLAQPQMQLSEWLNRWRMFGKHLKGFITSEIPGTALLADRLSLFNKLDAPLYVSAFPAEKDVLELYENNNICIAATLDCIEQADNLTVAVVDQQEISNNLEKLAGFIQTFLQKKSASPVLYLYIRGLPPSPVLMEHAETILSLVVPNE